MPQFRFDVGHGLEPTRFVIEIALQALQGNAKDVPVVDAGAELAFAETPPDMVKTVDIFRPEAGRMRAKVDEERGPAGEQVLQERKDGGAREDFPTRDQCGATALPIPCAATLR